MTLTATAEPGDRIRVLRLKVGPSGWDDNLTVPPGTEGTVDEVSSPTSLTPAGQVWVNFDNGHRLALLPGEDEWEPA